MNASLPIAIVAEHASARFGGEAALPLHYFRVLRDRGLPVWLVVHARTRLELQALFPGEERIVYVEDSWFHRLMWRCSHVLPRRIDGFTTSLAMRLATQVAQRRIVKRLVREHAVALVHQPMPVSPKDPSLLFGLGVPVLIGPMNGGIDYPPAFRHLQGRAVGALVNAGRRVAHGVNWLLPGKRQAAVLLVANERTRRALPVGVRGRVVELVENGVDLRLWSACADEKREKDPSPNFLFMGRLVDWKAVDILLQAFQDAAPHGPASLTILGDGPERAKLEAMCEQAGIRAQREGEDGKVFFAGWQSQAACAEFLVRCTALVLPSLMECGGAVVLEAMAAGRPVIATDWGGPSDYLDDACGILVRPDSPQALREGLARAMATLAASPERCAAMGQAGRRRVIERFDWERKVDHMLTLYGEAVAAA